MERHNKVKSEAICDTLDKMLKLNASVNFYMLHGGTSFGFWAGANHMLDGVGYQADTTSYDYDAPINEYGNLTQKFFDIQKVLSQYVPVGKAEPNDFVNLMVPKPVGLKLVESNLLDLLFKTQFKKSTQPLTFEELGIQFGYVAYRTTIDFIPTVPAKLVVKDLRDRAYVYVDGIFQGILSRSDNIDTTAIIARKGSELIILVESQGRVGFAELIGETKGLSDVSINNVKLNVVWIHYGTTDWNKIISDVNSLPVGDYKGYLQYKPRFFKGEFVLNDQPKDTLIDTRNWSKGVIWINGRNLGRYWHLGPQLTLYVPRFYLQKGTNTIILMEQEADHCSREGDCSISFTDRHEIDSNVPVTLKKV